MKAVSQLLPGIAHAPVVHMGSSGGRCVGLGVLEAEPASGLPCKSGLMW